MAVIIPTYNERENLESIAAGSAAAFPRPTCWSSMTTARTAPARSPTSWPRATRSIHVLHRPGKDGLGAAYIAGFGWALDRGYDVLVEMDADGSHQPEELPRLLTALQDADLVIGSRWVPGGTVNNWPKSREVLSRGGNTYARLVLGIPIRDVTGGYRAYRARDLARDRPGQVMSQGYCFQIDLAARGPRRAQRHRGADHLRRADPRRQQDEPGNHGRGAVAGNPVGCHIRLGRSAGRPAPASDRHGQQ